MVDWIEVRNNFPALQKYTYLNAAAGSPLPDRTAQAAKDYYDEMSMLGDLPFEDWLEKKERIRKVVADFINADPEEIAFIINTSDGLNIIADMLRGRGDVLTMEHEFPTTSFPWIHRGVRVNFVESEDRVYPLNKIEDSITSGTKMLITSHVQYCTGFRQDLEALGDLCRAHNLVYIVNATQSMGAMPVDVKKAGIDFLVFLGLKWPMAGYGIGAMYISRKMQEEARFPRVGWRSVYDPESMENRKIQLRKEASVLEMGCPPFPNIFALGESLRFISEIGVDKAQRRIFELNALLERGIKRLRLEIASPLQERYRSGITIIRMENAEEIVAELAKKNIIVSERGGGIRASVHIYNNTEDIDRFLTALKDAI
mgnify:CR=1 FL=1